MRKSTKRAAVESLSCSAIEVTSSECDWEAELGGNADGWTSHEAVKCEKCRKMLVLTSGQGNEEHCDVDPDSKCDGHLTSADGPMMSYYYELPVNRLDPDEAAKVIAHLPLCIVAFETSGRPAYALALTGGGQDLSWEICEAFMCLGYLPPISFAGLPAICGRGVSAKDRWIARGCLRSFEVASGWMKSRGDRVKAALKFGRKHELEAKARKAASEAKKSA